MLFHENSYNVDVMLSVLYSLTYIEYKFSHVLKNKSSKIYKFNHTAKTPEILTRLNNAKQLQHVYIINAIVKSDTSFIFIQTTLFS